MDENLKLKKSLTYEEIINLTPRDLLDISDFHEIANEISFFYARNVVKNGNGKLTLATSNDYQKLNLNSEIAFGLKLKQVPGSSIQTKLQRITDNSYITQKLYQIKAMYSEAHHLANSDYNYVTEPTLSNYKRKMEHFYNTIRTRKAGSELHSGINVNNLSSVLRAKEIDFCSTAHEIKKYASTFFSSWIAITISCPSEYHIKPLNGASSWDGEKTGSDANLFQNEIWTKSLKKLDYKKIKRVGFWTKEANASGAIHRHVLLFADDSEITKIEKAFKETTKREYKLTDSQFTSKAIHFDKGYTTEKSRLSKIVNYLIKYFKADKTKIFKGGKCYFRDRLKTKLLSHSCFYKYRRYGFFGLKNGLTHWNSIKNLFHKFKGSETLGLRTESFKAILINGLSKFLSRYLKNINFFYCKAFSTLTDFDKFAHKYRSFGIP